MSFKFRLQRILELRAQKEQAEARALAAARDVAEQAQAAHDALSALCDDSRAQVHAATTSAPRIGHLTQFGHVMESLDARRSQASEVVAAADADVQAATSRLEDAARDRRILDRLKVRKTGEYRAEEAQRDRVAMDEIALQRFGRKQDGAADAASVSASANASVSTSDTSAS